MENQQPTIEELLANMQKMSGVDPRPMRVLAAINPAFVFEQARSKKFVMEQPHIRDDQKRILDAAGAVHSETRDAVSGLIGVRHLTAFDLTTIFEYYHNGTGFSTGAMENISVIFIRATRSIGRRGTPGC